MFEMLGSMADPKNWCHTWTAEVLCEASKLIWASCIDKSL